MKDRLEDLKVRYKAVNGDNSTIKIKDHVEILDTFLEKVENANKINDEIEKNIELIKACQLRILSSGNDDQSISAQHDEYMRTIKGLASKARTGILSLEEDSKSDHLLQNKGIDRIKIHQHSAILKRFVDIMGKYNACQLEYRAKCKSRIRLQLQVAGTFVTEDKVEDMLDVANPCVFTEAIMEQTDSAKRSLMEIEARHSDILKLERNIEEMKEMFSNMALLVNQQGDLVDSIEHNVEKAADSVFSAEKQVKNARTQQKKTRKWKIICISIAVILLIIIIISIPKALGLM